MRVLFLPFFIVFFLIKTTPFLLILSIKKLLLHRSSIVLFLIFGVVLIVLFTSLSTPLKKSPNDIRRADLTKQKTQLENLLKKQPTHRDILLNLAKINQALENEQQALDYKSQALKLDPNSDVFQGK